MSMSTRLSVWPDSLVSSLALTPIEPATGGQSFYTPIESASGPLAGALVLAFSHLWPVLMCIAIATIASVKSKRVQVKVCVLFVLR